MKMKKLLTLLTLLTLAAILPAELVPVSGYDTAGAYVEELVAPPALAPAATGANFAGLETHPAPLAHAATAPAFVFLPLASAADGEASVGLQASIDFGHTGEIRTASMALLDTLRGRDALDVASMGYMAQAGGEAPTPEQVAAAGEILARAEATRATQDNAFYKNPYVAGGIVILGGYAIYQLGSSGGDSHSTVVNGNNNNVGAGKNSSQTQEQSTVSGLPLAPAPVPAP